jgi:biotin carboxyl carrier protein
MKLRITVHGVAYEVDVEVLDAGNTAMSNANLPTGGVMPALSTPAPAAPAAPISAPPAAPAGSSGVKQGDMAAPLAGIVHAIKCKIGDTVKQGDVLVILEAMKMLTNITAPGNAVVQSINVQAGDSVREGDLLIAFT